MLTQSQAGTKAKAKKVTAKSRKSSDWGCEGNEKESYFRKLGIDAVKKDWRSMKAPPPFHFACMVMNEHPYLEGRGPEATARQWRCSKASKLKFKINNDIRGSSTPSMMARQARSCESGSPRSLSWIPIKHDLIGSYRGPRGLLLLILRCSWTFDSSPTRADVVKAKFGCPEEDMQCAALEDNVKEFGLTYFGMTDKRQASFMSSPSRSLV
ncbi:3-isopropylmalate dehydratase [Mycena indigotica]|uniref:3-isopropylmalate dehydratase n=1 Tax=Mycena indigotica TaxID=2126181 RepID=A0A8H6S6Z7_9AGAR|nr:3-isopropylmalate dehydratase [Mycena indigotica]KAF7293542.1 3-isopropylmalate dehydratase [Mycena indigotica]